jgi:hypothetical protein
MLVALNAFMPATFVIVPVVIAIVVALPRRLDDAS